MQLEWVIGIGSAVGSDQIACSLVIDRILEPGISYFIIVQVIRPPGIYTFVSGISFLAESDTAIQAGHVPRRRRSFQARRLAERTFCRARGETIAAAARCSRRHLPRPAA